MKIIKKDMHGLSLFISDIRNCKCPEDEAKRVFKELAHIRSKFNGSKTVDGYKKKKYLCKLIFIFLLGHDFNIGVLEAINMISSSKYEEKFIGYLFLSVVLNEKSNLMLLVNNAVKNDLLSNNHAHQNLALNYVANMANVDMADCVTKDVMNILFHNDVTDNVKQSAILCLLRIFRIKPNVIPNNNYVEKIISFLSHPNLGLVISATSLIEALAERNLLDKYPCLTITVARLQRIIKASPADLQDYTYYFMPAPWLVVKLLRLLQKFPVPPESAVRSRLTDCIEVILNKCQEPLRSKKFEHRNSKYAILFETIALIHHLQFDTGLLLRSCSILDMELKRKESNLRYLALDTMRLLSESSVAKDRIKEQLEPIKESLYLEGDNCIRQKASDLLFVLCDESNVQEITQEMFKYLETGNISTKKETALKTALLAEKFNTDYIWYVDVILTLLQNFGEYVTNPIWFRLAQMIAVKENLQSYSSKRIFEMIKDGKCHENLVKVAGYILGEFGNTIAGDRKSNSKAQFCILRRHFHSVSLTTKTLLLTTFMKFINLFPDLKEDVQSLFREYERSPHIEMQQRAVEYLKLSERFDPKHLAIIFEVMPPSENSQSPVEIALQKIKPSLYESRAHKEISDCKQSTFKRSSSVSANLTRSTVKHNDEPLRRCATETPVSNIEKEQSYYEILAEIFSSPNPHNASTNEIQVRDSDIPESLDNLIWQNSGVLFEDDILQVFSECVFNKQVGRILLRYRNKSIQPLRNFLPSLLYNDLLKWKIQLKHCLPVIFPGGNVAQEICIECLQEFCHKPAISLSFDYSGSHREVPLKLPLTVNKFFEPITMEVQSFRERWANLSFPHQELKDTLQATYPMDRGMLIQKINGMGIAVHHNFTKNLQDICGAGIFHCKAYQVGFLLHLETIRDLKQYNLIVRASNEIILKEIARLLNTLL